MMDNHVGATCLSGSTTPRVHAHRHKLKQRFDIVRKLGQGTYGRVQLAINKQTKQEVAIKTIKKSKIASENDLTRIRREIRVMSAVSHPHIIRIYEVFENSDRMVLVMEYAAGGELYDYLSEHKVLTEQEARRIFSQVVSACYYCHKHKICHRDLKLENILLDESGNAKLADFGLSNVFCDGDVLTTFCGSPLYASPEIVLGQPYLGPEVDCWSLGVLLYTLVYGAMPFDGSNFRRLVRQITTADYHEPPQPATASSLIAGLLCVNVTTRLSVVQLCSHRWLNSCDDVTDDSAALSTACGGTLLESVERLACETPVRLDLLLSLPPQACAGEDSGGLVVDSGGLVEEPDDTEEFPPVLLSSLDNLKALASAAQALCDVTEDDDVIDDVHHSASVCSSASHVAIVHPDSPVQNSADDATRTTDPGCKKRARQSSDAVSVLAANPRVHLNKQHGGSGGRAITDAKKKRDNNATTLATTAEAHNTVASCYDDAAPCVKSQHASGNVSKCDNSVAISNDATLAEQDALGVMVESVQSAGTPSDIANEIVGGDESLGELDGAESVDTRRRSTHDERRDSGTPAAVTLTDGETAATGTADVCQLSSEINSIRRLSTSAVEALATTASGRSVEPTSGKSAAVRQVPDTLRRREDAASSSQPEVAPWRTAAAARGSHRTGGRRTTAPSSLAASQSLDVADTRVSRPVKHTAVRRISRAVERAAADDGLTRTPVDLSQEAVPSTAGVADVSTSNSSSSLASSASAAATAVAPKALRKSRREYVIPIVLEDGGGVITPPLLPSDDATTRSGSASHVPLHRPTLAAHSRGIEERVSRGGSLPRLPSVRHFADCRDFLSPRLNLTKFGTRGVSDRRSDTVSSDDEDDDDEDPWSGRGGAGGSEFRMFSADTMMAQLMQRLRNIRASRLISHADNFNRTMSLARQAGRNMRNSAASSDHWPSRPFTAAGWQADDQNQQQQRSSLSFSRLSHMPRYSMSSLFDNNSLW